MVPRVVFRTPATKSKLEDTFSTQFCNWNLGVWFCNSVLRHHERPLHTGPPWQTPPVGSPHRSPSAATPAGHRCRKTWWSRATCCHSNASITRGEGPASFLGFKRLKKKSNALWRGGELRPWALWCAGSCPQWAATPPLRWSHGRYPQGLFVRFVFFFFFFRVLFCFLLALLLRIFRASTIRKFSRH